MPKAKTKSSKKRSLKKKDLECSSFPKQFSLALRYFGKTENDLTPKTLKTFNEKHKRKFEEQGSSCFDQYYSVTPRFLGMVGNYDIAKKISDIPEWRNGGVLKGRYERLSRLGPNRKQIPTLRDFQFNKGKISFKETAWEKEQKKDKKRKAEGEANLQRRKRGKLSVFPPAFSKMVIHRDPRQENNPLSLLAPSGLAKAPIKPSPTSELESTIQYINGIPTVVKTSQKKPPQTIPTSELESTIQYINGIPTVVKTSQKKPPVEPSPISKPEPGIQFINGVPVVIKSFSYGLSLPAIESKISSHQQKVEVLEKKVEQEIIQHTKHVEELTIQSKKEKDQIQSLTNEIKELNEQLKEAQKAKQVAIDRIHIQQRKFEQERKDFDEKLQKILEQEVNQAKSQVSSVEKELDGKVAKKQKELDDMVSKYKKLNDELEKERSSTSQKEQQIQKLELASNQLNLDYQATKLQITQLENEKSVWNTLKKELELKIQQGELRGKVSDEDVNSSKQKYIELQSQNMELQRQLEKNKEDALQKLEEETTLLRNEKTNALREKHEFIMQLERDKDALNNSIKKLEAEKLVQTTLIQQISSSHDNSRKIIADLEQKLNESIQALGQKNQELANAYIYANESEKEKAAFKNLQTEHTIQTQKLQDQINKVEDLTLRMSGLHDQLEGMKQELAQKDFTISELRKTILAFESQNAHNSVIYIETEQQRLENAKRVQELETQRKLAEAIDEKDRQQIRANIQQTLTENDQKLAIKDQEIRALREAGAQIQNAFTEMKKNNEILKLDYERANSVARQAKRELTDVEGRLAEEKAKKIPVTGGISKKTSQRPRSRSINLSQVAAQQKFTQSLSETQKARLNQLILETGRELMQMYLFYKKEGKAIENLDTFNDLYLEKRGGKGSLQDAIFNKLIIESPVEERPFWENFFSKESSRNFIKVKIFEYIEKTYNEVYKMSPVDQQYYIAATAQIGNELESVKDLYKQQGMNLGTDEGWMNWWMSQGRASIERFKGNLPKGANKKFWDNFFNNWNGRDRFQQTIRDSIQHRF